AIGIGVRVDPVPLRDAASAAVALGAGVALVVSIVRRRAGVLHERERVAAMTGIDRAATGPAEGAAEFSPALDLIAPAAGLAGLVAAGVHAGSPELLAVARTLAG